MGNGACSSSRTSKLDNSRSNGAVYRELRKLKECFLALDADGSGSIGVEELVDPLIGLGFAETIH